MSSLLREEWLWQKNNNNNNNVHIPKHPELADKNVLYLQVMKSKHSVSPVSGPQEGTICLVTFPLVPYQGGHPVSLPPNVMPATLPFNHPEISRLGLKEQRGGNYKTHEGRLKETPRRSSVECQRRGRLNNGGVPVQRWLWSWTWSATPVKLEEIVLCSIDL